MSNAAATPSHYDCQRLALESGCNLTTISKAYKNPDACREVSIRRLVRAARALEIPVPEAWTARCP